MITVIKWLSLDSAADNNIRRFPLQVKNDLSLPVSQLLQDLTDFILQRTVDFAPIVPVSCDKLMDQILQGLRFELLVGDHPQL